MSDSSTVAKNLRDRLGGSTEDRLGRALGELLENPLLTGAIGRAFDAREKAAQAQEAALAALNLPSAADIERLTRRLRSVSQRLEGIEDGVGRLERSVSPGALDAAQIAGRLDSIEATLANILARLERGEQPTAAERSARSTPASSPKARKAKRAQR